MKIFLFVLVLFFLGSYNAQGNLQFNQVITYNIGGIANNYDNVNFTVPVGKVWKIMDDGRAWIAVKIG
jgi:hypothetical protein